MSLPVTPCFTRMAQFEDHAAFLYLLDVHSLDLICLGGSSCQVLRVCGSNFANSLKCLAPISSFIQVTIPAYLQKLSIQEEIFFSVTLFKIQLSQLTLT